MSFRHIELPQGYINHHVWQRDTGNLVIIVIDDEIGEVLEDPNEVNFLHQRVIPLLRQQACNNPYTRAIGFFRLFSNENSADETLVIIQEWITEVTDLNTQVYFLLDVLYGENPALAAPYIVNKLTTPPYSYSSNRIAYLTQGAPPIGLPEVYDTFLKVFEAHHLEENEVFSPRLMSFFGIGLHEDETIDDAIQFYAKAWNEGWQPEGWEHDALQNECSDHSKALADWLRIDVNDLCREDGQSAKSLVIWVGRDLWGDLREIRGNLLNAILKKLLPPSIEINGIPEDQTVYMPCTPCFPFLVSLRSFLLRCEEERAPVSKINFSQKDNKYTLRLMIKLNCPKEFEERFRETHFQHKKSPPNEHPFTRSLIYLIYCITEELPDNMVRDYMPLFTDGTEEPVIEVKITETYIDLIW